MNLSVSSTPPKNCLIIAYFDKANPYELTDSVGAFKKKDTKCILYVVSSEVHLQCEI